MSSGASAGTRRVHRTALGQLFALWAALPRAVRRFAADFAAVAAEEGREVPVRLAWAGVAIVIAALFVVAGWIVFCLATAAWLVEAQGWRWEMALFLVGLVNLLLALTALVIAYRSFKTPFFPVTSYELHRLRTADNGVLDPRAATEEYRPLELANPGPRERALMRSEAELEARLSEVRRITPQLITTPSVIAAAAGIGLVAGYASVKRKRTKAAMQQAARNMPLSRQLLQIALGQLSSLAVAAALREVQRRAGYDRPPY